MQGKRKMTDRIKEALSDLRLACEATHLPLTKAAMSAMASNPSCATDVCFDTDVLYAAEELRQALAEAVLTAEPGAEPVEELSNVDSSRYAAIRAEIDVARSHSVIKAHIHQANKELDSMGFKKLSRNVVSGAETGGTVGAVAGGLAGYTGHIPGGPAVGAAVGAAAGAAGGGAAGALTYTAGLLSQRARKRELLRIKAMGERKLHELMKKGKAPTDDPGDHEYR